MCTNCGHVEHIFGAGGGARMAAQHGVALLGELPLDARIREEADGGTPDASSPSRTAPGRSAYIETARRAAAALARRARDRSVAVSEDRRRRHLKRAELQFA